jgi:hypothetical protein
MRALPRPQNPPCASRLPAVRNQPATAVAVAHAGHADRRSELECPTITALYPIGLPAVRLPLSLPLSLPGRCLVRCVSR